MIKVLLPSIIILLVLAGSSFTAYKLIMAHALWKKAFAIIPLFLLYIIVYGFTWGFWQLKVREITYTSPTLPKSFDGYRIAVFSDLHCGGAFWGPYTNLLRESIDTINSRKPDAILFLGDIQNFLPKEAERFSAELSALKAPDGVFSIMGNHDYSSYSNLSMQEQRDSIRRTRDLQHSFGWKLLENECHTIYRLASDSTQDSICIVGEENWGLPPFPQLGNIKKATAALTSAGKADVPFTIFLSHDPTAWDNHIKPFFKKTYGTQGSNAIKPEITLSGHTHGSQFSIFGWTPVAMKYKQWGREYYDQDRLLEVTTGLGGNLPFRFNMPREIVIITLKAK